MALTRSVWSAECAPVRGRGSPPPSSPGLSAPWLWGSGLQPRRCSRGPGPQLGAPASGASVTPGARHRWGAWPALGVPPWGGRAPCRRPVLREGSRSPFSPLPPPPASPSRGWLVARREAPPPPPVPGAGIPRCAPGAALQAPQTLAGSEGALLPGRQAASAGFPRVWDLLLLSRRKRALVLWKGEALLGPSALHHT